MVDPCLLDEARLSRLSSITNHPKLTQSFSLLKVTEIPPVGFNNLRTAVIYYVFSNLSQFYKNASLVVFPSDDNLCGRRIGRCILCNLLML